MTGALKHSIKLLSDALYTESQWILNRNEETNFHHITIIVHQQCPTFPQKKRRQTAKNRAYGAERKNN